MIARPSLRQLAAAFSVLLGLLFVRFAYAPHDTVAGILNSLLGLLGAAVGIDQMIVAGQAQTARQQATAPTIDPRLVLHGLPPKVGVASGGSPGRRPVVPIFGVQVPRAVLNIVAAAVAMVVAVAFFVAAYSQFHEARAQERVADARALAVRAQLLLSSDPATAQSLAAAALKKKDDDPQALAVAMTALTTPLHHVTTRPAAGPVVAVASLPGSDRLVTGSATGEVSLLDSADGLVQVTALAATRPVNALAVSPGGTRVAAVLNNRKLQVWSTRGGTDLVPVGTTGAASDELVTSVSFLGDDYLVTGARDRTNSAKGQVTIWQLVADGVQQLDTVDLAEGVTAVAASPAGDRVVSGGVLGTTRIWKLADGVPASGTLGRTQAVSGVSELGEPRSFWPISTLQFSPDGSEFVSANEGFGLDLWKAGGEHLSTLRGVHTSTVTSIAFAPGGQTLASGGRDGVVGLWDLRAKQPPGDRLVAHTGSVRAVSFDGSGDAIWSTSDDGTMREWAAATSRGLGTGLSVGRRTAHQVAFSSDGQLLAAGDGRGDVHLWNTTTQARLQEPEGGVLHRPAEDDTGYVTALSFARITGGEEHLFVAYELGEVREYQLPSGDEVKTFRTAGKGYKAWGLAISPDGKTLAVGCDDAFVRLFDVADGASIDKLQGNELSMQEVSFSADGKMLAASSDDGIIRLWNTRTYGQPTLLRGHQGKAWGIAFSPDGSQLAAAGEDHTIRIWPTRSEDPRPRTLSNRTAAIDDVAFLTPRRLMSTDRDAEVRLWDLDTGAVEAALPAHDNAADGLAVLPGLQLAATTGNESTVRLWDLNPHNLIRELCERVPERLTREDWSRASGGLAYAPGC